MTISFVFVGFRDDDKFFFAGFRDDGVLFVKRFLLDMEKNEKIN